MARAALRIDITKKDQKELKKLLAGGIQPVRVVLRAVSLLQMAKGVSAPRIAAVVPLTPQAIRKVGHRYQEGGLERALYEKERPGAASLLEDSQRQRIIAMVCSDPPAGRARWTVRLVAEEAVKRRLGIRPRKRVPFVAEFTASGHAVELPVDLDAIAVHPAIPGAGFATQDRQVGDSSDAEALP